MSEAGKPRLEGEDKQLVDLVTAVLVDPNLHTDMRMRIHQEILQILTEASANASGRPSGVLRS